MEWISVENGLPEVNKKVLVWDQNNTYSPQIMMGYYDPETITSTGWRCVEYMDLIVTHWTPLPDPPKE